MNDTPNTTAVDTTGVEIVRHFYVDEDGNEVEIPFDADGKTYSGSEAAPAETAFIAEDAPDHAVTVH